MNYYVQNWICFWTVVFRLVRPAWTSHYLIRPVRFKLLACNTVRIKLCFSEFLRRTKGKLTLNIAFPLNSASKHVNYCFKYKLQKRKNLVLFQQFYNNYKYVIFFINIFSSSQSRIIYFPTNPVVTGVYNTVQLCQSGILPTTLATPRFSLSFRTRWARQAHVWDHCLVEAVSSRRALMSNNASSTAWAKLAAFVSSQLLKAVMAMLICSSMGL